MEERMLEDDELRKIKIKRNRIGGVDDATEDDGVEAEEIEDDLVIEMPETDEYDEDEVGLSPKQLRMLREKKERDAAQSVSLCGEAQSFLLRGEFEEAESFFRQAAVLDGDNIEAKKGLWSALSKNFTDDGCFYDENVAFELAQSQDEVKEYVKGIVGERLAAEREVLKREAAPLREEYDAETQKRREAFRLNYRYYLVRFCVAFGVMLALMIATVVSAMFLPRTQSMTPVVLVVLFGLMMVAGLVVTLVFTKTLLTAKQYCRLNEKLSSTEQGQRLAEMEEKLRALDYVLGEES